MLKELLKKAILLVPKKNARISIIFSFGIFNFNIFTVFFVTLEND